MKTAHGVLRDRLLTRAGLLEKPAPKFTLDELAASEWSPKFEQLMRNRLIMGALRYGKLGEPGNPKYDRLTSMSRRLNRYACTGNLELLVDIANLCLCEFVECHHPFRHWHAVDGGEHVGRKS